MPNTAEAEPMAVLNGKPLRPKTEVPAAPGGGENDGWSMVSFLGLQSVWMKEMDSLTDLGCESFDLDMQRLKDVKEILGSTAIVVTLALRNACTAERTCDCEDMVVTFNMI